LAILDAPKAPPRSNAARAAAKQAREEERTARARERERSRSEREADRARRAAERDEKKRAKELAKAAITVDYTSRGKSPSRPPPEKPALLPVDTLVAAAEAALGKKVAPKPKAKSNSARKASVEEVVQMAKETFRGRAKAKAAPKDTIRRVPVKRATSEPLGNRARRARAAAAVAAA
jgi:colicin import membrane protein